MECRKGRWKSVLNGQMILFWLYFSTNIISARNIERYEAAYECEGKTLSIECGEDETIHLIRANYGRFSITICNEHGNTDWSVNCKSSMSFRVLYNMCNKQRNCSIAASTSQFGDPCPTTLKYLEAHYQCESAATTTPTSRPSPPWLLTSQHGLWSTSMPAVRPALRITPHSVQPPLSRTTANSRASSSTSIRSIIEGKSNEGELVEYTDEVSPGDPNEVEARTQTTPLPFSSNVPWKHSRTTPNEKYPDWNLNRRWDEYDRATCPSQSARNLIWNTTRVGEVSVQNCPGGASGVARWQCVSRGSDAVWHRDNPDLSECQSAWLTSLEKRVTEEGVILTISRELSQVTNTSRVLFGGDMLITTKIIKSMAEKMAQDIKTYPEQRQKEVNVDELLQGAVMTSSNLLDRAQMASWKDLSYEDQMIVATSLLIGLEENAFLFADILTSERKVIHQERNILMDVRVLDTRNINSNIEIFSGDDSQQRWSIPSNKIELSKSVLLENNNDGFVRLVFMAFDRLEEILQPQAKTLSTTIYDNEDPKSNPNTSRILNSKVVSASLGKGKHVKLSEPVRVYFKHLTVENVTNPTCVFWDYTMSEWSEEGCSTQMTNSSHTVCECTHLTNFAVLMDIHTVQVAFVHQVALQIITYVGCTISVICLILTILTFHIFRGLKSDRITIHKNLCSCLLIAEVIFLCGIHQTNKKIICGIIAGLLHFFFLCSFAWMFLEGFQLYVMLIEVFEAEKSRLRWYYLAAYGSPLLIVAISSFIDPVSYGTERYCWLSADNYLIFSFVGPVILVIVANLVFLSMAIYTMCRHMNTTITMKNKEHSRLASARAWLRGAIVLMFLLGLTWTFGLLYLNQDSIIMAYIFTILNSLQGLFIFMFHCIQNEKVRKEYRKLVRRHSWLPNCLRCSKSLPTASGISDVDTGANGGKDFATQNPSSIPSALNTDSSGISPNPVVNNISFKPYSHGSGHGALDQIEPSRTNSTMTMKGYSVKRQENRVIGTEVNARGNSGRLVGSNYNHTYTDLREDRILRSSQYQMHSGYYHNQKIHVARGSIMDDPIYEEIQRGSDIQVSDISNEDGRRPGEMTRQSSSNYSDHRPLIPYSASSDHYIQYGDQNVERRVMQYSDSELISPHEHTLNSCWEKIWWDQSRNELSEQSIPRLSTNYTISSLEHTGTVAVLDGQTVVCHLQPQTDMYTGRNLPPPSYSEC